MYHSIQHHFVAKPPRCLVSYWIDSFKRNVLLKCADDNLFITGFSRLNPPDNTSDPISLLEQARCCSAILEFSSQHGTCEKFDWQNSLKRYAFNISFSSQVSSIKAARLLD